MRSFETISYIHALNVRNTALETRSKKHEHFSRFLTLLLVRVMRILWSFAAGRAGSVVFLFALSDVTHFRDRGD
jgi:hypothetical protein